MGNMEAEERKEEGTPSGETLEAEADASLFPIPFFIAAANTLHYLESSE